MTEARLALAARLARIRGDSGLTQGAFADRLGFPKRTYLGWERGETEPPIGMLTALRRAFAVDPDWVLHGPGSDPRSHSSSFDWPRLSRLVVEIEQVATTAGARPTPPQVLALARTVFETEPASERALMSALKRMLKILEPPATADEGTPR